MAREYWIVNENEDEVAGPYKSEQAARTATHDYAADHKHLYVINTDNAY